MKGSQTFALKSNGVIAGKGIHADEGHFQAQFIVPDSPAYHSKSFCMERRDKGFGNCRIVPETYAGTPVIFPSRWQRSLCYNSDCNHNL